MAVITLSPPSPLAPRVPYSHVNLRQIARYKLKTSVLSTAWAHPPVQRWAGEAAALREAAGVSMAERSALHTILDAKIRSLVAQLASGLRELPTQVRTQGSRAQVCAPEYATI